jgi:predicted regulator of Ras-like GTPase activity (Roadblock/LC7/MglB family)
MSEMRGDAQAAIDELVSSLKLVGAGLVSRDGLPVLLRFSRPIQEDTFSAMSAALLGAAEAALQELAEERPASALVETAGLRFAVAGLDDSNLLVAVAPAGVDAAKLRSGVEKAQERLRKILGG